MGFVSVLGSCDKSDFLNVFIIVLLLLVIYKIYSMNEQMESGYFGRGLDNYVYTSGATMRRLGQVFSQPGQGVKTTIYNAERRQDPNQKTAEGIPVMMYMSQ
jgi:hypothetical protein